MHWQALVSVSVAKRRLSLIAHAACSLSPGIGGGMVGMGKICSLLNYRLNRKLWNIVYRYGARYKKLEFPDSTLNSHLPRTHAPRGYSPVIDKIWQTH